MFEISPLTAKRFRSFRRIRRAWYSLIALAAVFVFCLLADVVCSCDPRHPVDRRELEAKYREPVMETVLEVRDARFTIDASDRIVDFEGPADVAAALAAPDWRAKLADEFTLEETTGASGKRVYLRPKTKPEPVTRPAVDRAGQPIYSTISFPFRPCAEHPLGIDAGGRCVYSRVVHGMRIALIFGLVLALFSMFLGLVIGAIEGYFGGKTDIALQRFTEIWSALPFLYVMIFIGSTWGRGFTVLLVCYGVFSWISVSYYMRAEFLRLRSRTFVEAAKCQGFSARRIIFGHILPNALTPLITLFPFLLMGAIGSLAALDFLGFGMPPMTPSCGELMNQAQQFRWAWWLILFPALALFIVMLLTVFVGEGLRDAFDPRQKSKLE